MWAWKIAIFWRILPIMVDITSLRTFYCSEYILWCYIRIGWIGFASWSNLLINSKVHSLVYELIRHHLYAYAVPMNKQLLWGADLIFTIFTFSFKRSSLAIAIAIVIVTWGDVTGYKSGRQILLICQLISGMSSDLGAK